MAVLLGKPLVRQYCPTAVLDFIDYGGEDQPIGDDPKQIIKGSVFRTWRQSRNEPNQCLHPECDRKNKKSRMRERSDDEGR